MREVNWTKFRGSMPLDPIVRPTGKAKDDMIARMRRAWERLAQANGDGGSAF
jgi:hypothetical protein